MVNLGTNKIQVIDVGLIFDKEDTSWLSPDPIEGPTLPAAIEGYHEETWKFEMPDMFTDERQRAGFIAVIRLGSGQVLKTEWTQFD